MLTPSLSAASAGPGCGGITPCITDKHANNGRNSRRKGCLVWCVRVRRIGASNTNPTANHVVSPIVSAKAIRQSWMRDGPKTSMNRRASTSAPPDSASKRPSIVPSATMAVTPPSAEPTPSENDFTTPSIE
jgi:hypothetical protein